MQNKAGPYLSTEPKTKAISCSEIRNRNIYNDRSLPFPENESGFVLGNIIFLNDRSSPFHVNESGFVLGFGKILMTGP